MLKGRLYWIICIQKYENTKLEKQTHQNLIECAKLISKHKNLISHPLLPDTADTLRRPLCQRHHKLVPPFPNKFILRVTYLHGPFLVKKADANSSPSAKYPWERAKTKQASDRPSCTDRGSGQAGSACPSPKPGDPGNPWEHSGRAEPSRSALRAQARAELSGERVEEPRAEAGRRGQYRQQGHGRP